MEREDAQTLRALGFSDEELDAMGLLKPAVGAPAELMEAYLRRSKKREDLATMRAHLKDIVRYAETQRPPLKIRRVWFEQLSASKAYVRRPEFEKGTQAVFDGLSKTLAFWKTDRFDRRGMGAVGRMLDEFDRRGAGMVSVTESLDSRQSGARIVFAILSERAREEAKDIALRVTTGHVAHKSEGRRGTGRPPYGLTSARNDKGEASGEVAPNPTEFKGARLLAELMLGEWQHHDGTPGEPLSATATAKRLNALGVVKREGGLFTPDSVSRIVQSPLFGGMVPVTERVLDEYGQSTGKWRSTREPMLDAKGDPLRCGEGVVSPAEWYRIRAGFQDRTDTEGGRGKRGATYLLTGIARCGRCDGWMRHHRGYYRCVAGAGAGTCKGNSTRAPRLENEVSEAWVQHVTALEPGDPVMLAIAQRWLAFSRPESQAEQQHTMSALRSAQERVQKLEDDYYVHGRLTEERYEELSERQRATMEVLSLKLESLKGSDDLSALLDPELIRETWLSDTTTVADKRAMLKAAIVSVTVAPAKGRGDQTPIDKRVSYAWVIDQENAQ
jgi:DNA invertase Pin-like site-specific DNA recombinase